MRARRLALGVQPVFKRVDTCAAEFESFTPYLYSTYEDEDEAEPTARRKIMILGSGPNRIGQGIEFDYCCVHAAYALKEEGFETIMVNCNPETVSTDYDTSDRLYFEPLTFEDVMAIVDEEKPDGRHRAVRRADAAQPGAPAQGRRRAHHRHFAGVHRPGRRPQALRQAARRLGILQPQNGAAMNVAGGGRDRARNRISRPAAPLLRAGRTRHGDRLR